MFQGSLVAISTPMKKNGEVDYESYSRLISFHLENKSDGIVPVGTTGESATLNTGGTLQPVLYMNYFNNKNNGNLIVDARISYHIKKLHKLALISSNILNRTFSLRPLKVEPMRTIMFQYSVSI